MILKIFFTPQEVKDFFLDNGFRIEDRGFSDWIKRTHGPAELVEVTKPAVVLGSEYVDAEKLFEKVAEYRLKNIITPTNNSVKNAVKILFKTLYNE